MERSEKAQMSIGPARAHESPHESTPAAADRMMTSGKKVPGRAALVNLLEVRHLPGGCAAILLSGESIGRLVRYGVNPKRGNVGARTEFGSRIFAHGTSIEVAGPNSRSVLVKVASEISRLMREGVWPLPTGRDTQAADAMDEEHEPERPRGDAC